MTDVDRPAIGFIGLGNMGGPMAARLVAAGFVVRGYDPVPEAGARFAEAGGQVVEAVPDAVTAAAVVFLMLPNSTVVRSVMTDPAVVDALSNDAIVVDMSSSEPAVNQQLAADLAAHGVRMIDAPVSGGVTGATQGSLTIMAGGDRDDVEAVRAVLDVLGRVVHVGPIGSGDAIKAFNNLLSATHLWVTGEVMAAGARFGLDPDVMLSVFNASSGRSGSTEAKWPTFIRPGTYDSGFALRLMLKDMRIATELCEQLGVAARLGEQAVGLWQEAADALDPTADHTEVAAWLERSSAGRRQEQA